jgi:hypothetical protein
MINSRKICLVRNLIFKQVLPLALKIDKIMLLLTPFDYQILMNLLKFFNSNCFVGIHSAQKPHGDLGKKDLCLGPQRLSGLASSQEEIPGYQAGRTSIFLDQWNKFYAN